MAATIAKTGWQWNRKIASTALLLILLSVVSSVVLPGLPDWQAMWLIALLIYFASKWLTLGSCHCVRTASVVQILGYLLLWPGMDAKTFLDIKKRVPRPKLSEWSLAIFNFAFGLFLLFVIVRQLLESHVLLAGWFGLAGLVLTLHFGLFHFLSLGWRLGGVDAQPIMNFPILASSLSDFWGRRWNMGFRDLAFGQLFRPLVGRIGIAWATMAVFVASGLVHELVISVPVRAGWGGPTSYFILQGAGFLVERSSLGRRLGFSRGVSGRILCGLFVLGPIGLLFHEPFIRYAILPTLSAIGAA